VLEQTAGAYWSIIVYGYSRPPLLLSMSFQGALSQVIDRVDALLDRSPGRWEELLWYAHALVYHVREGDERRQMAELIRERVRRSKQTEVEIMGKTIAEVIKEEGVLMGREEGVLQAKRQTLVRQLHLKFKRVPAAIEAEINATHDVKKLDDWLDEVFIAKTLSDIHFSSRS
jgi:hypothetical protein